MTTIDALWWEQPNPEYTAWWESPSTCIGKFCPLGTKYRDVPDDELTTLLEQAYEQGPRWRFTQLCLRAEMARRCPALNPLIEEGW